MNNCTIGMRLDRVEIDWGETNGAIMLSLSIISKSQNESLKSYNANDITRGKEDTGRQPVQ
jgi:hypothetical protein